MANATAKTWAEKLKDDRIARRLTWDKYRTFLGMPMATVQKIVRGITVTPQELTQAQITECLARPVDDVRPYDEFQADQKAAAATA